MKLKIITIILLFTINNLLGKSIDNIKMFTEQFSPYSMMIDGKLAGTSVEILDAMLRQMKSKQNLKDVRMTNWARGYALAQKKKNTMIFSTGRTKQREELFKWVGPISKITLGIIAPKRKNIKINKISDLKNYRIGAVLKSAAELLLLSHGVKKDVIQTVKSENATYISLKKIEKDKIDLFAYAMEVAFSNGKAKGFDMSQYEVVYVLKKIELYFAFNKNTDDIIINKWQKALDDIKDNGLYSKIIKK